MIIGALPTQNKSLQTGNFCVVWSCTSPQIHASKLSQLGISTLVMHQQYLWPRCYSHLYISSTVCLPVHPLPQVHISKQANPMTKSAVCLLYENHVNFLKCFCTLYLYFIFSNFSLDLIPLFFFTLAVTLLLLQGKA